MSILLTFQNIHTFTATTYFFNQQLHDSNFLKILEEEERSSSQDRQDSFCIDFQRYCEIDCLFIYLTLTLC